MPFLSKLNKKVNILENNVRRIRRELDGPKEEAQAVNGITDATISTGAQAAQDLAVDQLAQQGITPLGNFEPGAMNTAAQMFGTSISGSFDRNMGSPLSKNKIKKIDNEKI